MLHIQSQLLENYDASIIQHKLVHVIINCGDLSLKVLYFSWYDDLRLCQLSASGFTTEEGGILRPTAQSNSWGFAAGFILLVEC